MNSGRGGVAALILFATGCISPHCRAIDSFQNVPVLYTQSPQVFESLFTRANCSTVRALIFGDSQETSPGGLGSIYVPRLNYELWLAYGNTPETPLTPMMSVSGGGTPWGDWILTTGHASPGLTFSRLNQSQLPPNMLAAKGCLTNGSNINNNQWYGQLMTVQHDASRVNPNAAIPVTNEYFKRGTHCYVDVFAATNPSSGEVRVRACPTLDGRNNFYVPTTALLTSTMGLEEAGPTMIRSQRIGPLPFNSLPSMQIELFGSRADKFTDIITARLVSSVDPRGVTVSSIAQGGYRVNSMFENHANCGAVLGALGFDVAVLTYGANDSGFRTAEQYKSDVLNLIAFIRGHTRPDLPVILIADPFRIGLTAPQADALDRYPGACYEIALADMHVCALNSRRMLDAEGWNQSGYTQFLSDTVHYSPAGAILKARTEIAALLAAFRRTCVADTNSDCGVTIEDLLDYLVLFDEGRIEADIDDGSFTGTPDLGITIDDMLYFLSRFDAGC